MNVVCPICKQATFKYACGKFMAHVSECKDARRTE